MTSLMHESSNSWTCHQTLTRRDIDFDVHFIDVDHSDFPWVSRKKILRRQLEPNLFDDEQSGTIVRLRRVFEDSEVVDVDAEDF